VGQGIEEFRQAYSDSEEEWQAALGFFWQLSRRSTPLYGG
jgi:hypothetical protein